MTDTTQTTCPHCEGAGKYKLVIPSMNSDPEEPTRYEERSCGLCEGRGSLSKLQYACLVASAKIIDVQSSINMLNKVRGVA